MRILFLLNTLTAGGAERVTVSLANHWAANGHQVAIVTMGAGSDFYALDPCIIRHHLDLAAPSHSLIHAVASGSRRVRATRRLLRTWKPDVAIAMMTSWNIELALASRGLSVRTIGSERIHPPTLPLGRAWEGLRRHLYGWLDVIVAQTEKSRNWIAEHTNARDVRVIPNPVAVLGDAPAAMLPTLPDDAPVILGVGRLVGQKRFDRLIAAFAAIQDDARPWHLVLVGEGVARDALIAQTVAAGLTDRVHFAGKTAAIEGWYRRAAMFVLSSDFEGFPNALLEAMACGIPSIATDCDTGPADLIVNGENGVLVPNDDDAALAAAMRRLVQDATLRASLGNAARAVSRHYAPDAIAARWEALFGGAGGS